MDSRAAGLEAFLGAVLRGAAKILGCNSTNLILINEHTREIRIRLGTPAHSNPLLAQVERLLGDTFGCISFPTDRAQDSLVYRCWRDRTLLQTSSLAELVGSAFSPGTLEQLTRLIGEHRFICVPALSSSRNYGVLLFEKEGCQPFSRQQCQLLLRYARRIGEIVENDLMGQGLRLFCQTPATEAHYLLFDEEAQLIGEGPAGAQAAPGAPAPPAGPAAAAALDTIAGQVRAFLAGGTRTGRTSELQDRHLDAKRSLTLTPFSLGGRPCVLCSLRLREERGGDSLENQLLHLTLGEPAPALFVDPEFHITSCNAATEQMLGYAPPELQQVPIDRLFRDPGQILEILQQQLLHPAHPYCEEPAIVLGRQGQLCPARVEALPLADDMDQVVGFLVLLRPQPDGTGSGPERLVQQERLATMGEMAAQLAHEIRNPLLAIGVSLEGLSREPKWGEAQRSLLARLGQEIVRLDMVLKDYLAAARQDLSFSLVPVAEVVQNARLLLEGSRRSSGKQLTVHVPPELLVRADRDAIKHVLFNLLLNALEASPAGGEVVCWARRGAHDISLFVDDRGPGLGASPAECFQPFFTTKKNGTGLGLAVCQKIAHAHGGVVDLRNREQGGCRAVVILPATLGAGEEEVVS